MKFKSLSIFLIISSFFLTCILSIWKIMSTLQGLSFTNLNITPIFLIGILLSLAFVLIGNKINHLIKIFLLSFIFSILYFFLNEASPYWYIFGVFLITLFFTNKLKKYSIQSLKEEEQQRIGRDIHDDLCSQLSKPPQKTKYSQRPAPQQKIRLAHEP